MLDIGLWELMVIGVLGLIVLGPERLPVAVRTVLEWIRTVKRTVKRMVNNVKDELAQELDIDKLHSDLKKVESYSKDLNSKLDPKNRHQSIKSLLEVVKDVTCPDEILDNREAVQEKEGK
ncbi:MAG: twin-arginine translocase subunit TatB [Psychrobium sp.]|nr:twin-arginine translocase subunit TatB [Psychrobium sp.]